MSDRELLAAAQLACEREVWDRCINTSDKTRAEIDIDAALPDAATQGRRRAGARDRPRPGLRLRPDPPGVALHHRRALAASAPAGLMQLMPATARWTAKKIGLPYTPTLITDRDTNLRLGTAYLKLVLDDFGGSQAMAAAAYNAGPGRPRKWREGPVLDAADLGREHPVPRDARLRQEGALEQLLSTPRCSAARHGAALAPRPHDRPARSERAAAGQRPALSGPRARRESAGAASPATSPADVSKTPRPRRAPAFVGRSVCEKLVERSGGAERPAARRRRGRSQRGAPPAAAADGRDRASATSMTMRARRACCATPTR